MDADKKAAPAAKIPARPCKTSSANPGSISRSAPDADTLLDAPFASGLDRSVDDKCILQDATYGFWFNSGSCGLRARACRQLGSLFIDA